MFAPLKVRVTNSGRGNSANSTVNNFSVDAYTTTNSAGALVRKDMQQAVYEKWESYRSRKARYEATYFRTFLDKNH